MRKIFAALYVLLIGGVCNIQAQDIHFTQFYAAPLIYNPAFTGYIPGDFRASTNFRMQWDDFGNGFGNPYQTIMASADVALLRPQLNGATLGVGSFFINDVAGDANYKSNTYALSLSYIQPLDRYATQYLAVGFQGSFNTRSLDQTKLTFPNQVEIIPVTKYNYFNMSAGLIWLYEPTADVRFYLGMAAHNLLKPPQSHFDRELEELFIRITGQFGAQFIVSDKISLIPSILFQKQGPHQEMAFGTFVKYKFGQSEIDLSGFQLGFWYRFSDAIVPVIRFDYKWLSFIFNYDVNISKLSRASKGNGAPEISITYQGRWSKDAETGKRKPVRCPVL